MERLFLSNAFEKDSCLSTRPFNIKMLSDVRLPPIIRCCIYQFRQTLLSQTWGTCILWLQIFFSMIGNMVMPRKLSTILCLPDFKTAERIPPAHNSGKSRFSIILFNTIATGSAKDCIKAFINSAGTPPIPGDRFGFNELIAKELPLV